MAFSSTLMCISIVPLGVYFHLDENKNCTITEDGEPDCGTVDDIGWLPLVCLMVYIAAFSLGFGPLPWAMNAEMFPQEAKEKGSQLMTV